MTREEYLAQPTEVVRGEPSHPETCIQRYRETGVYFREFTVDSGKGGKPVVLTQITDMHFNLCDKEDEANEELMLTNQFRKWNADGVSEISAKKAMEYAQFFDRTVITGDTLDYLSHGAITMLHRLIWDVDPNAIVTLGGHELVREMQTGVRDKTSIESRRALLASVWKHDIYYYSEVIADKVMIIAMDNNPTSYYDCQIEPFRADLERARRENLVVLIFEHEPISTGNPDDTAIPAIMRCDPETCNFWQGIGCPDRNDNEASRTVYRMIVENGDIIRGIFCGHQHSAFYTEIRCPDGHIIPQPVLEGNVYNGQAGHVMRITVL